MYSLHDFLKIRYSSVIKLLILFYIITYFRWSLHDGIGYLNVKHWRNDHEQSNIDFSNAFDLTWAAFPKSFVSLSWS